MDAIDPEIRDEMLRYMSKELKAVREQLEEERRKTRASGTPAATVKEDVDVAELREENEAQQKRLEVLEEENARLWHHVARFESGEEDKPIALDITRHDDRHARLFELYYMPKDQYEAHCAKLRAKIQTLKEKRDAALAEAALARSEAEAIEMTAPVHQDAEAQRTKYKAVKSELKEVRAELEVANALIEDRDNRINGQERTFQGLNAQLSRATTLPRYVNERPMAERHIARFKDFIDKAAKDSRRLVKDPSTLQSIPVCDFFPKGRDVNAFKLNAAVKSATGLHESKCWFFPTSRMVFLKGKMARAIAMVPSYTCPPHEQVHEVWKSSKMLNDGALEGRRDVFYEAPQGWKYVGHYECAFSGLFEIKDIPDMEGFDPQQLVETALPNKDLTPPIILRTIRELFKAGALRVLCLALERVDFNKPMEDALHKLAGSIATGGGSGSRPVGRHWFTGEPIPIVAPGQSSSSKASASSSKRVHHKESEVEGPPAKKKK